MAPEAAQERGRDGVIFTRRWLEATTFVELPWNAYENENFCSVPLLRGGVKVYDLRGHFLHEDRQPVLVENKAETTAGHQTAQHKEFLANAYSATAKQIELLHRDPGWEFFWVTSHPFGTLAQWASLSTKQAVVDAVTSERVLPDGGEIDDDLAATVAERAWLLVVSPKQERLTLDRAELDKALTALERKKSTL